MPISHVLITMVLLWLFAGSLVWLWLHMRGSLECVRFRRNGIAGAAEAILFVILVLVAWPAAIAVFGPREFS